MFTRFGIPFYLAHGALGFWDEVIFVSVVVIFLVMMGIAWFRSRSMDFRADDLTTVRAVYTRTPHPPVQTTAHKNDTSDVREPSSTKPSDTSDDTYFELD